MKPYLVAPLLLLPALVGVAQAGFCQWKDPNGVVQFSNQCPKDDQITQPWEASSIDYSPDPATGLRVEQASPFDPREASEAARTQEQRREREAAVRLESEQRTKLEDRLNRLEELARQDEVKAIKRPEAVGVEAAGLRSDLDQANGQPR